MTRTSNSPPLEKTPPNLSYWNKQPVPENTVTISLSNLAEKASRLFSCLVKLESQQPQERLNKLSFQAKNIRDSLESSILNAENCLNSTNLDLKTEALEKRITTLEKRLHRSSPSLKGYLDSVIQIFRALFEQFHHRMMRVFY